MATEVPDGDYSRAGVTGLHSAWVEYRGTFRSRAVLTGVVGIGYVLAAIVRPDDRLELFARAVATAVGLVHPLLLLGVLAETVVRFDVVALQWASGVWAGVGWILVALGLIGMTWRTRRGLIRLEAIVVFWSGLVIVSPVAFVLLALTPAAMIFANRRRRMMAQPEAISVGPTPAEWSRPIIDVEREFGVRYLGTLHFTYPQAPDALAAVYGLPDCRGWAIALDSWLVMHTFGGKVLFTFPWRWTVTLPNELGQLGPRNGLEGLVLEQRRVLARLATWGVRPDRMSDTSALTAIIRQFETDSAIRARGRFGTVLRSMIDEELNLRRDPGPGLVESDAGVQRLREWAGVGTDGGVAIADSTRVEG